MTLAPFGQRLAAAIDARGPLCVGIDPHPGLLAEWGLGDTASGVREFGLRVVEALTGVVAAIKPQSAFFEAHGSAGVAALEDVLAAARAADLLTVLDAKRGDIGSTMSAYARAYLGDGSPLAADALTVSPYLGFGSLTPAIELASQTGRGLFILALTSNPEGAAVQHARTPTGTVAGDIAEQVRALNRLQGTPGSFGLVVGATIGAAAQDLGLDLTTTGGHILAPGFGAQGAGNSELREVFGSALDRNEVLVTSSRAILSGNGDASEIRSAANRVLHDLRRCA